MTFKRIQVAADSVCDLPAEIVNNLDIRIIPTYVNIDDQSIPDDGARLDRQAFYRQLPSMRAQPTTSAPSPGEAEAFYRDMLNDGAGKIVSIHVPERLSGVLNTMRLGARAVDAGRVTLVDSLQLTFGIGFQVWAAAELAVEGASLDDILEAIERVRQHTEVYAIIDTMQYLQRSGRVNSLVAGIGTLLKIKPIVRVADGDITSLARSRTWSRAEAKLKALTQDQAPLDRLAILHIDNRVGAERFLDSIREIAPQETHIIEVCPTLGAHIGPGSIGVATLKQDWRN
ncbi:MAG: DegV family protein [Chloroflexota bacterium]|nr:DegV family protein [Chloroflexota bacterium]